MVNSYSLRHSFRPLVARVLGYLAVAACLLAYGAAHAAAAGRLSTAKPPRHVLCWYEGKPITVREATGCSYGRGLRIFRAAYRKWGAGAATDIGAVPPLAVGPGHPTTHWASRIYTACLNGVLARYLRYMCVCAIRAKYRPDTRPFVDAKVIPAALARQAKLYAHYESVEARGLEADWSGEQFCGAIKVAFPNIGGSIDSIRSYYWPKEFMVQRAFYLASIKAFPPLVNQRSPATWQRWDFYAGLEQIYISIIAKKRRAFFTRLANERYGTWHFIIAIHAVGGKRLFAALRELASGVAGTNRMLPNAIVAGVDRSLLALGSPTQIAPGFGTKGYISVVLTGLPIDSIAPLKFMPAKCPKGERPGFLYIYSSVPTARYQGRNWGPGSQVCQEAEDYIVPPLVKRVLQKARAGPGFTLPTAKWLVNNMWDPSISDNLAGTPIPKVIIKLPWPKPVVGVY